MLQLRVVGVLLQNVDSGFSGLADSLDWGVEVAGHIDSAQVIAVLRVDNPELQLGREGIGQELVQLRHFLVLEGGEAAERRAMATQRLADNFRIFADLQDVEQQIVSPDAILGRALRELLMAEVVLDSPETGRVDAGQILQHAGEAAAVEFVQLRFKNAIAMQDRIRVFHMHSPLQN